MDIDTLTWELVKLRLSKIHVRTKEELIELFKESRMIAYEYICWTQGE